MRETFFCISKRKAKRKDFFALLYSGTSVSDIDVICSSLYCTHFLSGESNIEEKKLLYQSSATDIEVRLYLPLGTTTGWEEEEEEERKKVHPFEFGWVRKQPLSGLSVTFWGQA